MDLEARKTDTEVAPVPLMTPQQAAAFLAVPVLTLQTWRAHRTGPRFYRVGRHVRYRREDLEEWLERQADRNPRDSAA
jgi:excisionase family DNA binding protein